MTQDPEILSSPLLRQPVEETFAWVRNRMVDILKEGQVNGEFSKQLDMEDVAEMIMSVLQGGLSLPWQQATSGPTTGPPKGF